MKTALLITCGKKKQSFSCEAKDMYLGSHSKRAIEWAQTTGKDYFIIGLAKGLIHPNRVIAPYDRLPPKKLSEVPANFTLDILKQLHMMGYEQVLFACNKMYYLQQEGAIGTRWAFDELKMAGMGWQGNWFKTHSGTVPPINGTLTTLFKEYSITATIGQYATAGPLIGEGTTQDDLLNKLFN